MKETRRSRKKTHKKEKERQSERDIRRNMKFKEKTIDRARETCGKLGKRTEKEYQGVSHSHPNKVYSGVWRRNKKE